MAAKRSSVIAVAAARPVPESILSFEYAAPNTVAVRLTDSNYFFVNFFGHTKFKIRTSTNDVDSDALSLHGMCVIYCVMRVGELTAVCAVHGYDNNSAESAR